VEYNCCERFEVKDLDWINPPVEDEIASESFDVVIGSDLFYDSHHPEMVVKMLERYLKRDHDSRVVMGYPLRASHSAEVADFEQRIGKSFVIEASGEEIGMDDWDKEIHCIWAIYKRRDP